MFLSRHVDDDDNHFAASMQELDNFIANPGDSMPRFGIENIHHISDCGVFGITFSLGQISFHRLTRDLILYLKSTSQYRAAA